MKCGFLWRWCRRRAGDGDEMVRSSAETHVLSRSAVRYRIHARAGHSPVPAMRPIANAGVREQPARYRAGRRENCTVNVLGHHAAYALRLACLPIANNQRSHARSRKPCSSSGRCRPGEEQVLLARDPRWHLRGAVVITGWKAAGRATRFQRLPSTSEQADINQARISPDDRLRAAKPQQASERRFRPDLEGLLTHRPPTTFHQYQRQTAAAGLDTGAWPAPPGAQQRPARSPVHRRSDSVVYAPPVVPLNAVKSRQRSGTITGRLACSYGEAKTGIQPTLLVAVGAASRTPGNGFGGKPSVE